MVYSFSVYFEIAKFIMKTYYFKYRFQIPSFKFQIDFAIQIPIKINYSKLVHLIKCYLMQRIYRSQNEDLNYTFNINFEY